MNDGGKRRWLTAEGTEAKCQERLLSASNQVCDLNMEEHKQVVLTEPCRSEDAAYALPIQKMTMEQRDEGKMEEIVAQFFPSMKSKDGDQPNTPSQKA